MSHPRRPAALALAMLPLLALPAAGLAAEPLPPCLSDRAWPPGLELPAPHADGHTFAFEDCVGTIRPGAPMTGGCTLNFVFADDAGGRYIGTAGHCTAYLGQRIATSGVGPFGSVVFRRCCANFEDFSLIKVDADKLNRVSPTLCAWGGPIGAADPGSALPRDALLEYGWGFVTLATPFTRARVHGEFATYGDHVTWNGVGSGGDSGAPVVNQAGYAVAIHTFGQTPFAGVTLEGGPSLGLVLELGRTAVPSLRLVTGDPTNVEQALGDLTY